MALTLAIASPCLASCASLSMGNASSDGSIKIGVTPSITFGQVYYAAEKGIFTKHGLDVEIVDKGNSEVPALLGGEYDVVTMASPTFVQAVSEGIDLNAIFPGVDGHPGAVEVMAMPKSGVRSVEKLKGRTVAINQPGAVFEIQTRILLNSRGVDQNGVDFSVIPFSSMVESLAGGKVDSAVLTAPYNVLARQRGAETVNDIFAHRFRGLPIATFVSTPQFTEEKKFDKFEAAMTEASQRLNKLPDGEFNKFIGGYTGISPEVVGKAERPTYPTKVTPRQMQRLADSMRGIGRLRHEVDISSSIVEPRR